MRTLVVGWSSVLHGEATAGDVLAMDAVADALGTAGVPHDVAWSAVMCPPGGLRLDDVEPVRYTHLLFVCGPATGRSIAELHEQFAHCLARSGRDDTTAEMGGLVPTSRSDVCEVRADAFVASRPLEEAA